MAYRLQRGKSLPISLLIILMSPGHASGEAHPSNMHTVFLSDCNPFFQWQSLGMYYSHQKDWMHLGPTYVANSMTHNPHNGDHYSAYNKPYAIIDWLTHAPPEEEWLVILDADMLLRLPFLCRAMPPNYKHNDFGVPEEFLLECKRGRPIAAFYGYLQGATNHLAEKHIPEVPPQLDTVGGQPYGRRADQVGGLFVVHRDDMKDYMNDWLKLTEDVRFDKEAWKLSGDVYATRPGDKPWISEMYGYIFSAAKHSMHHRVDRVSMIYPGYLPSTPPRLLHYGLMFNLTDRDESTLFEFDKHWHYEFDIFKCPPWGDIMQKRNRAGLFPHPPDVANLTSPLERLRDLLVLETIVTLNEAFCELHLKRCPSDPVGQGDLELQRECSKVTAAAEAIARDLQRIADVPVQTAGSLCVNRAGDERCRNWARNGDCDSNAGLISLLSHMFLSANDVLNFQLHRRIENQNNVPQKKAKHHITGYMSSSCVEACDLCYPTLSEAVRKRFHLRPAGHTTWSALDDGKQNLGDPASFTSSGAAGLRSSEAKSQLQQKKSPTLGFSGTSAQGSGERLNRASTGLIRDVSTLHHPCMALIELSDMQQEDCLAAASRGQWNVAQPTDRVVDAHDRNLATKRHMVEPHLLSALMQCRSRTWIWLPIFAVVVLFVWACSLMFAAERSRAARWRRARRGLLPP